MSKIEKVIHVCGTEGTFQYNLNERIGELQKEGFVLEIQYGNPIQSKYNTNINYSALIICREEYANCLIHV